MSYSFQVKAATKDEAKQSVTEAFDTMVRNQPIHQADRAAAETAVGTFVDLLSDPSDAQQVIISVSGSLGWSTPEPESFTNANVSVTAYLGAKD